jgi:hypothetical protein
MTFGPYGSGQALYYTTAFNGGEVRRITRTGAVNRPPTAVVEANPTSGALPLAVDFDASGSSDPDAGDTLTYLWDFAEGLRHRPPPHQRPPTPTQPKGPTPPLCALRTTTVLSQMQILCASTLATRRQTLP